jgi:hypothetical protein
MFARRAWHVHMHIAYICFKRQKSRVELRTTIVELRSESVARLAPLRGSRLRCLSNFEASYVDCRSAIAQVPTSQFNVARRSFGIALRASRVERLGSSVARCTSPVDRQMSSIGSCVERHESRVSTVTLSVEHRSRRASNVDSRASSIERRGRIDHRASNVGLSPL